MSQKLERRIPGGRLLEMTVMRADLKIVEDAMFRLGEIERQPYFLSSSLVDGSQQSGVEKYNDPLEVVIETPAGDTERLKTIVEGAIALRDLGKPQVEIDHFIGEQTALIEV